MLLGTSSPWISTQINVILEALLYNFFGFLFSEDKNVY